MGHVRLGVLPKSRKWRQVVDELRLGSEIDVVAASAADAAETALRKASNDPGAPRFDKGPAELFQKFDECRVAASPNTMLC